MSLQINKLDFLISLYIFCLIVAELMGGKTFAILQIGSFHLNASVGIFLIPLIYSINDTIIEVYGTQRAKSIYRSGLCMIVFLLLFSILAIKLPPSARFVKTESAYELIFGQSIRIALASLTAFAISDLLDIMIFSQLTQRLGKTKLWLRTNLSNIVSEFFDTTLFMVLAFYALDKTFGSNALFLSSLILPYWLLKCAMSVIETPFVYLGVKWLKGDKK